MHVADGSELVKDFDEEKLRSQLVREKERSVEELSNQYDTSISKAQEALQNIDSEYSGILQRELSYITNNKKLRLPIPKMGFVP